MHKVRLELKDGTVYHNMYINEDREEARYSIDEGEPLEIFSKEGDHFSQHIIFIDKLKYIEYEKSDRIAKTFLIPLLNHDEDNVPTIIEHENVYFHLSVDEVSINRKIAAIDGFFNSHYCQLIDMYNGEISDDNNILFSNMLFTSVGYVKANNDIENTDIGDLINFSVSVAIMMDSYVAGKIESGTMPPEGNYDFVMEYCDFVGKNSAQVKNRRPSAVD